MTAADIAAQVMAVYTIDLTPLSGISQVDADVQNAISKMYDYKVQREHIILKF